jgi:hypothetical protein
MLRRALESLQAQTHPDWQAMVLDDSPDGEAAGVVAGLAEPRVQYQRHASNLGASQNLDLCFRREPFFSGSTHACILEDDNYFAPGFIAENLGLLDRHGVRLVLRNQWIFFDDGNGARPRGDTCRSGFLEEGLVRPQEFLPHLPFHCGVSNGGLLWRLDCRSELVVGSQVENSSHQEILRTFQLAEPLWYADTPLAHFRAEDKGWHAGRWRNATALRASQSIALRAVRQGPPDFWERAQALADRHTPTHQAALDAFAIMALNGRRAWRTMSRGAARWKLLKSWLVRGLVPDPLGAYWRGLQSAA